MSESIRIRCREHGPLVVEGAAVVYDHLGNAFPIPPGKDKIALCRCGQSHNKPFCDGSHKTCGFQAAEIAPPPAAPQT
jgi:CDGSH iron-sulfur domain-containing protein 3